MKEGKVTKFSFSRNDAKEVLATGMANSYGSVEKNSYRLLTENASGPGNYTKGSGAVYPYVNVYEPFPVLASCLVYMNGNQINWNYYSYTNAVIHRQGLGFRGFEKIICSNNKGEITQTYEPYNYSILKSEDGPGIKNTNSFSVSVDFNKIVKIRLTNKSEENKATKQIISSAYTYDTYGNPLQITESYPGGISVKTVNTYNNQTAESNYMLGLLTDKTVTTTRNGASSTERVQYGSYLKNLPQSKISYFNGNQTQNQTFTFYDNGNTKDEIVKLYSSGTSLKTTYYYDAYGRLTNIEDPKTLKNQISYNSSGRVEFRKDSRDKKTSYSYDAFGRILTTTYPDNSSQTLAYSWASEGVNGIYAIMTTSTGRPTTKTFYDAQGREVRNSQTRYNSTVLSVDKVYDSYGRLQKSSLPFAGTSPTLWTTYSYDSYDRPTSIVEASGKKSTMSYNGLSQTIVEKNITSTKTYDALGYLISTSDPAGTITYNLRPDGQTASIVAPGNITTTLTYDNLGRQITLADPSTGTITYDYDPAGNVKSQKNANGQITTYTYDNFNRIVSQTTPEFKTNYAYSLQGELTEETSSNGTSKNYTYDEFGRLTRLKESIVDGRILEKYYTYSLGNVNSITYTSQSGKIATENYYYANGYLTEVKLDGTTSIYKLSKENASGQPGEIVTGNLTHSVDYDSYGVLTGMRSKTASGSTFQNFSYAFNAGTCNLNNRKDLTRNLSEDFGYDNLNRLTSYAGKTAQFDVKGNLTQKSDIGTFAYANSQKPYAVSDATLNGNGIPARTQNISYNSFSRPSTITENGYVATFTYNGKFDRVKLNLTNNGSRELTRYYLGNCYEIDETASTKKEKLYLAGNYYTSPVVYVKENSGSWQLYYISRDYLGSITHITDASGNIKQELSYDAWGRLRNPVNQTAYAPDQSPQLFLGRGYTGHEYLPQFGLVNMNARLYDPALGIFLAPDPFIQSPDFSQNFNRYAYAMNNPLCYIDRDGQLLWFIPVGLAIIGAYIGGSVANHGQLNPLKWDYKSATTYLGIGFGAIVGYVGGYGIINPGSLAFAGGISTPYIAAGVTVGAMGQGTDWKFDFHWTTAAGGGGSITNIVPKPEDATNKAIQKAQWDYSAYKYASTSLLLLADDPTVVGTIDDVLIPIAYGVATYQFLQTNQDLVMKQAREIDNIIAKNLTLKNGFVYELQASKSGYYPNVRGGQTYLNQGDVWKYGQTTNGNNRYTKGFMQNNNLILNPIFYGNQMEILIQEKIMIYGYVLDKGNLPPGNRIFR